MPYHKKNFFLDFIVKMSGGLMRPLAKVRKICNDIFSYTNWMKMGTLFCTVHRSTLIDVVRVGLMDIFPETNFNTKDCIN